MKQLLAAQELLFPTLFQSLQTAMKPLMARDRTGLEGRRRRGMTEEPGTELATGSDLYC